VHKCKQCGDEFDTEQGKKAHQTMAESCTAPGIDIRDAIEQCRQVTGEHIIYTLKILHPETGEEFFYVGRTGNDYDQYQPRISLHKTDTSGYINVPNKNGEMESRADYTPVEFVDAFGVSDKCVSNEERKAVLELAIKHGTNKVLGGH
jgi:hypothetical protein